MSEQPSGQMPPSQPAPPQPVPSQPAPPQPAPPQSAVPPQAAAPPQPAPPLQPQPAPPLQPAAPPPPQPAPPQYAPQAAPSQPQPVAPPSQPASQAQITDALNAQGGVAEGMHRIHPAYIVLNSLQALLVVVIIAISSLAPMISSVSAGDIGVSIGAIAITAVALLLLLAAIVGFGIFYYLRFSWGLSESEVCINSGIIFKKQVRIPFQKVQSIDFQARVIERIVGIVRLKIETAGGVSNRAVGIPALKLNQAEALRAEVFRRKQQASALENANIQAMINARRNQPAAALDGASGATITPRFDPQTGAPLPAAAPASAAFTPRFDPQTGAPLPAPAPASAAFTPRFDPQTGAPLPAAFPPPTAPAPAAFAPPAPGAPFAPPVQSSADTIVGGLGELSSQMRGVFAGSYDENAPIEYEYGLRARELFLAGLSSDQNILGMVVIFFALTSVFEVVRQAFSGFGDIETELIGRAASSGFAIVLPIILLFIIVIYLLAVIGTVVNYGGFQARRRGGRIEVEHGLLQRSYRGVGIQRIQAVEVKQGLIRRMIGYAELRLQTVDSAQAASSNSQQKKKVMEKGLILHPFVKLSQVDTIIHGLLPEFDGRPRVETQQTLPRVAIRRTVNRRVFFSALITLVWLVPLCTLLWWMRGLYIDGLGTIPSAAINAILVIIGILFVVIFVFRAFGAVLWYRHARYSWNDSHLFIRHGAWSIDEVFIPHQKIQWGEYKQTPFQRVSKVATIQASTAAGVSGTHIKLRDLRLEAAEAYLAWLCADESSQPVDYREQPEFTQKPVRLDLM